MEKPNFIDFQENENINDEENDKNKVLSSKMSLPFLNVNIEKIPDSNNLSNKLEKNKLLINSQTDKLLIAGFEGDEDDFKKCYKKFEPIKKKKFSNMKQRKINKLLIKDDYLGPIKLTKVKEFNFTLRQKNKLLEKINQLKTLKNNENKFNKNFKTNKICINGIINNNTSKFNNNNNSINNGSYNIYYNNSTNNIFNNSTTNNFYNNSLNSLKGSYFFYKNTNQNKTMRRLNNRSLSQNNFITLRDILTNTSHNINNINDKLKNYIRRHHNEVKIIHSENYNKTSKKMKSFDKRRKSSLFDILDSLKRKHKDQILKRVKKDDGGTNNQNIWIKKSTANLVSFGKSFLYLADDLFYREKKRILAKYPEIEKDADLRVPIKNDINFIKKMHKQKMEQNSKLIKDLNFNNKRIVSQLNKRMKSQI